MDTKNNKIITVTWIICIAMILVLVIASSALDVPALADKYPTGFIVCFVIFSFVNITAKRIIKHNKSTDKIDIGNEMLTSILSLVCIGFVLLLYAIFVK